LGIIVLGYLEYVFDDDEKGRTPDNNSGAGCKSTIKAFSIGTISFSFTRNQYILSNILRFETKNFLAGHAGSLPRPEIEVIYAYFLKVIDRVLRMTNNLHPFFPVRLPPTIY